MRLEIFFSQPSLLLPFFLEEQSVLDISGERLGRGRDARLTLALMGLFGRDQPVEPGGELSELSWHSPQREMALVMLSRSGSEKKEAS
jgi:hypothetical protein